MEELGADDLELKVVICSVSEILVGRSDRLTNNGLVRVGNFLVVKNVAVELQKACERWETLEPTGLMVEKGA